MIATNLGAVAGLGRRGHAARRSSASNTWSGVFEGDGRTPRSRGGHARWRRGSSTACSKTLDLGASFSQGDVTADAEVEGVEPVPRGLPGEGASLFRFYDPHFVDGRRRRLGADARWSQRAGGHARGMAARDRGAPRPGRDLRRPAGGDRPRAGSRPPPGSSPGRRRRGRSSRRARCRRAARARSSSARATRRCASTTRATTPASRGRATARATSGPREARALTGGLSWWPESWIRLMGNVVLETFRGRPAGAGAGPAGAIRDHPGPAPGLAAVSAPGRTMSLRTCRALRRARRRRRHPRSRRPGRRAGPDLQPVASSTRRGS